MLEKGSFDAKTVAKGTKLPYSVVIHHLRLLEMEEMVKRKGSKPYIWGLTGLGQKRLIDLV
jgi:sugar-specific transcriptional regulator TrmB